MTFIIVLPSCKDTGTGPGDDQVKEWYGQLSSEVVYEVLKPDGRVWAWGNNSAGTLGNGTSHSSDFPSKVLNLHNVTSIDQSFGAAVAADKNGDVWFWGNSMIYLGLPGVDTNVTVPMKITHVDGTRSVTIYAVHIYLLKNDGTVWHIRLDWYTPTVVDGPRKIEGISNAVSVQKHLELTTDGQIYDMFSLQSLQDSLRGVIAVSGMPERHVLALKNDGTVWAWGANDLGQLGNGTFKDSNVPTKVKNLTDVVAISASADFNLAVMQDGTVWFWGFAGRQGDTLIGLNTPVQIHGLGNVVLIYAGANCLAMTEDGTYWTFSVNDRIPKQVQLN